MLSFFVVLGISFLVVGCASGPKTNVPGGCRSCKPYFVRGEWHHPQDYFDYDHVGLASWYGPGFHGKPKPFGEKYDQNALTAAHKTLPIPTIALVTNVETGQQVKVLIDDRGPFVYEGRIIDLSMAAAKQIGVYQKGVAKVRVQSLVEESKALAHYLSQRGYKNDPRGRTWLQIYQEEIEGRHGHTPTDLGSSAVVPTEKQPVAAGPAKNNVVSTGKTPDLTSFLKTLEPAKTASTPQVLPMQNSSFVEVGGQFVQKVNADKLVLSLKNENLMAHVTETVHSSGQKLYSVRVGPYDKKDAAQHIANMLTQQGYSDVSIAP